MEIYKEHSGCSQIIFCDYSTPKTDIDKIITRDTNDLLAETYSCMNRSVKIFLLTFSIIEHIMTSRIIDIQEWRCNMPRAKFQTLTEQMFYILLCLKEECYGMDILDRVPAMTQHRVNVGSGTLYNLLEQFAQAGMIRETKVERRRRSYILTDHGREMLEREYRRISAQVEDFRRIFGEDKSK